MIVIFAHLLQAASTLPTDASALESSISALESEIRTLESSSVPWEYSVLIFTLFVVVGVAMELWVIRHEWRDDMESWALAHFGVVRPLGRPSKAKLRVEVGSVLLITIGILGELGIGIEIASINGALRGKSAELRSKTGQLVALLNQETEQLRKDAEGLKAENLKLEAQIAPRRVSSKQAKILCSLIHVTGGPTLNMWSSFGTAEADDFAEDIGRALAACGFGVTHKKSAAIVPVPAPFRIGFAPNRKHDADMINTAMLKAKIATKPIERAPIPDADKDSQALRLFVGPKSP